MAEYLFNVDNGYLEGLVRGFRSGILNKADYLNLVQCETVEGKGALLGSRCIVSHFCACDKHFLFSSFFPLPPSSFFLSPRLEGPATGH